MIRPAMIATMRLVPVAVLLLFLTACSSSTDDPPPEQAETASVPSAPAAAVDPADELEDAVAAYSSAFLAGDGNAAYALLSERCRDRTPESELVAASEQAAAVFGPDEIETVEVSVNGAQAKVTYTYATAELNQTGEPWSLEDGAWLNDDC